MGFYTVATGSHQCIVSQAVVRYFAHCGEERLCRVRVDARISVRRLCSGPGNKLCNPSLQMNGGHTGILVEPYMNRMPSVCLDDFQSITLYP